MAKQPQSKTNEVSTNDEQIIEGTNEEVVESEPETTTTKKLKPGQRLSPNGNIVYTKEFFGAGPDDTVVHVPIVLNTRQKDILGRVARKRDMELMMLIQAIVKDNMNIDEIATAMEPEADTYVTKTKSTVPKTREGKLALIARLQKELESLEG